MRWFGRGKRQVQTDPGRAAALVQDVRQRFGPHVQAPPAQQAAEVAAVLGEDDDGLLAAVTILREYTDAAYADLYGQAKELHERSRRAFAPDRGNYRPFLRALGPQLRWTLLTLPNGLHPYVHVVAAATAVGGQAKRVVKATDPVLPLTHVLETLDLTVGGWEFARVRVDTDAGELVGRLIRTTRDLHDELGNPPPLPPAVRELMRTNWTVDVYDPVTQAPVGGFSPGRMMREVLLT